MSGERSKWVIRWDDHVLSENDITIGQAERIELVTGESWLRINPLRSAKHAAGIATVMVADATGEDVDVVAAKVKALRVGDFLTEILDFVEDDTPGMHEDGNPPVAGTSTGSLPSSRKNRGAGRQPSSDSKPSAT